MTRRSVGVALVIALALLAAPRPRAAEHDLNHRGDTHPASDRKADLRPQTPTSIGAAIKTLERVRLHPGRDDLDPGGGPRAPEPRHK